MSPGVRIVMRSKVGIWYWSDGQWVLSEGQATTFPTEQDAHAARLRHRIQASRVTVEMLA